MRSVVVLPQPDGPTSTLIPPRGASNERLSTATVPSAYLLVTLSKRIIDARLTKGGRDRGPEGLHLRQGGKPVEATDPHVDRVDRPPADEGPGEQPTLEERIAEILAPMKERWPQLDMADALSERLAGENRATLLPLQLLFAGPFLVATLWSGARRLALDEAARDYPRAGRSGGRGDGGDVLDEPGGRD